MAFEFFTSLPAAARAQASANIGAFVETRQPIVWVLALVVGLSAGAAAILFRLAIGLVQWPWLGTVGEKVATAAAGQPW